MYHFFARDYDPEVGLWLQQDVYRGEFDAPATLHRYAYVLENPLSYSDQYGYFGLKDWVKDKWNTGKKWVEDKYNQKKERIGEKYNQGKKWVEEKIDQGKKWVQEKYNQGKKWVEEKIDQGKKWVQEKIDWAKQKAEETRRKTTAFVQREIKKLPQKFQEALKTGKQIITGDAMKMVTSSIKQVWNDPVGTVMSAAQKADKFVNWVEDKGKFIAKNGISRCRLFVDILSSISSGVEFGGRLKIPGILDSTTVYNQFVKWGWTDAPYKNFNFAYDTSEGWRKLQKFGKDFGDAMIGIDFSINAYSELKDRGLSLSDAGSAWKEAFTGELFEGLNSDIFLEAAENFSSSTAAISLNTYASPINTTIGVTNWVLEKVNPDATRIPEFSATGQDIQGLTRKYLVNDSATDWLGNILYEHQWLQ